MKRLRNSIGRHPMRSLVAGCYMVGLVGLVLLHLFGFISNRVMHQNGTLAEGVLSVDDFILIELEQQGDTLVTTGTDPQLILKDATRKIDKVRIDFVYSINPHLINVFYTKGAEDGYSARNSAYPGHTAGGNVFLLPSVGGEQLRIDPGSVPGNTIHVNGIVVNEPRPWWSFFVPAAGEWVLFLFLPGLFACALSLVMEGLAAHKAARKGAYS